MAGVFGVAHALDVPASAVISAAEGGQRYLPWLRATRHQHPGLDALHVLPAPWDERAVGAQDDGVVLLLDGEVFEGGAPQPAGDAGHLGRWLLARYRDAGIEALCGLNGTYNVIVWNVHARRLELANDVLGLQPLFLWCAGPEMYFGSACQPLLAHPGFRRRVDLAGLGDLLSLGYTIGDRTLLAGVTRLAAGSTAAWDARGLTVTRRATVRFSSGRWAAPLPDLVAAQQELLERAFRRRVEPGLTACVPLSGGLDSRTALGFVSRLGGRAEAIHMRPHRTRESAVAAQVARTLGVPLHMVTIPRDFLWRYRSEQLAMLEGQCDAWLSVFLVLLHRTGERFPVWMSGFLGDAATSSYSGYASYADGGALGGSDGLRFSQAFGALRNKEGGFTEEELAMVLRPEVARTMGDVTRETSRRLYESNGEHDFQRFMHWEWLERQRYFVGSYLRLLRNCGHVRAPFADREHLDFAASLPLLALHDKLLYRARLRTHEPALARIVYSNEGYPVEPSLRVSLRTGLRNAGRRWRRRLGLPPRPDDPWIPVYGCRPPEFAGLLRETREVLCDYFDPGYIDALIRDIPGPTWSHYPSRASAPPLWDKARKVVTFALWCRAFLMHGDPARDSR